MSTLTQTPTQLEQLEPPTDMHEIFGYKEDSDLAPWSLIGCLLFSLTIACCGIAFFVVYITHRKSCKKQLSSSDCQEGVKQKQYTMIAFLIATILLIICWIIYLLNSKMTNETEHYFVRKLFFRIIISILLAIVLGATIYELYDLYRFDAKPTKHHETGIEYYANGGALAAIGVISIICCIILIFLILIVVAAVTSNRYFRYFLKITIFLFIIASAASGGSSSIFLFLYMAGSSFGDD